MSDELFRGRNFRIFLLILPFEMNICIEIRETNAHIKFWIIFYASLLKWNF